MKKFLAVFLTAFLCATHCFSQDTSGNVFRLGKLPPNGIILDKGWKFQPGDDPVYARPCYDDSKWQDINPNLEMDDQPPAVKTGICWLRLHIFIDSSLLDE